MPPSVPAMAALTPHPTPSAQAVAQFEPIDSAAFANPLSKSFTSQPACDVATDVKGAKSATMACAAIRRSLVGVAVDLRKPARKQRYT